MTDYTPKPWTDDDMPRRPWSEGFIVLNKDDWERARACARACAGIPTEQLLPGNFTEVINVLIAILDDHESDLSLEAAEVARDALAPFRGD